jgi:hypothetical protein
MLDILEKKKYWESKILEWKKSKRSINSWCKERKIPASTFSYWKDKIFPKPKIYISKKSFTEITEKQEEKQPIEIKVKGITIKINKNFDEETLKKCLEITRSL